jgi:hypothetical protein
MGSKTAAEHGIVLLLEEITDAVDYSVPEEGASWWWSDVSELPWEFCLMYDYGPTVEQTSTIAHFIQWTIARLHEVAVEMGTGFEHFVAPATVTRIWEIYSIAEAAAIVFDRGPFAIESWGLDGSV